MALHTNANQIDRSKAELREVLRARIRGLGPEPRSANSLQARGLLLTQSVWKEARSILFYAPLPEELDIWPLVDIALAERKEVSLPRFDEARGVYVACRIQHLDKDLQKGHFGIREAASSCAVSALNRLDLALVPALGYDLHGRRLGRGKGFYDRLLAQVSGLKCGVAFDEQIVSEIPSAPHDERVNCILTPTRWRML